MTLQNNLRRLRFDQGEMSQQTLADLIGVTRMTIYSIEKGKYIPSTVLALRISKVFNRPVEEIFFLIDDNNTKKGEIEND
jgi:putative transcriptional regulator